jgi:hypothetical protein
VSLGLLAVQALEQRAQVLPTHAFPVLLAPLMAQAEREPLLLAQQEQQLMVPFQLAAVAVVVLIRQILTVQAEQVEALELPQA